MRWMPGATSMTAPILRMRSSWRVDRTSLYDLLIVDTAEQMVAELREIHIDLAVLFPDHLLKLPVLPQADYAAALARAYNAWLVDQWTSRHDALLGAIVAC